MASEPSSEEVDEDLLAEFCEKENRLLIKILEKCVKGSDNCLVFDTNSLDMKSFSRLRQAACEQTIDRKRHTRAIISTNLYKRIRQDKTFSSWLDCYSEPSDTSSPVGCLLGAELWTLPEVSEGVVYLLPNYSIGELHIKDFHISYVEGKPHITMFAACATRSLEDPWKGQCNFANSSSRRIGSK